MKLFRRISALALAFVLICLLSTSAFAAATLPPSRTVTNHYFNGYNTNTTGTASLSIAQYTANALFYVQDTDSVHNVFQIDMEYSYLNEYGQWRRYNRSVTETDNYDANLVVTLNSNTAVYMEKATARFQATFGEYTGGPFIFDETLVVGYTPNLAG